MPDTVNPFSIKREPRDIVFKLRLTKSEHEAITAIAKKDGVDLVDVFRDALGMLIEHRSRQPRKGKR